MTGNMINIGANKETVAEAHMAIIDILNTDVDQSTKVVALETLKNICSVRDTTISNCQFSSTSDKPVGT